MLNPATRRNSYLPALAATLLLVGCGSDSLSVAPQGFVNPPAPLSNSPVVGSNLVAKWSQISVDASGFDHSAAGAKQQLGPTRSSRAICIVHIAMHDALNAVAPRYQTYAFHQKNSEADPIAAAATAAYEVLVNQLPTAKPMLDSCLAVSLASVPEGSAKTQGIEVGKKAAAAIIGLRQNDGAFQDPISVPAGNGQPGEYHVVPPFDFVFAPFWKTMQPFSLQKPEQFRNPQQPAHYWKDRCDERPAYPHRHQDRALGGA